MNVSGNSFALNKFNDFQQITYNTNTNHPLIPNSQEYIYYKKYVSIHSEDRNMIKYPSSSEFEIELPEDLLNVASLRLSSWSFPSNYNTFSVLNENVSMTFKIDKPYNPNENDVNDILVQKIFEFLFINQNNDYFIIIEQGFYNPQQMVTELTNKFNASVTLQLNIYFNIQINNTALTPLEVAEYQQALQLLNQSGGYSNFNIVYNNVSQKIWFGNICDGFTLTNETQFLRDYASDSFICTNKETNPDFSEWGLPGNIGLSRCNASSVNGGSIETFTEIAVYNGSIVPRFYYGDVSPGDNGFWLLPNPSFTGSNVNWVEADYKINFMGAAYMYMELEGQNCIDETQPYNISDFTIKTNSTNGIVNSSFAKIAIPTTPISQWFDRESTPYKFYYPPAERMRKFNIKLRYHNGQLVNFGVFNYSFVIEFTLQLPQILRTTISQFTV
jgi:hypothetical protein